MAWANYLLTRGLNPGSNVETGVIPSNASAVNFKLPLYANVRRTQSGKYVMPRPTGAATVSGGSGNFKRSWSGLGLS